MIEKDLTDAIAYFRVSTDTQAEDGRGYDYYYHLIRQYGFSEEQIYSDIDSGGNDQRKGYQLVLARLRGGGVKRVFVPDFTRFTRSPRGWEEAISDFRLAGARLITLDGSNFSLDTPENIYMSRMLVANAAYVREQNQYKSLKGMEFKRLRGDAFKAKFPYKIIKLEDKSSRLSPNLDQYKDTDLTVWDVGSCVIQTFIYECPGNLSGTLRILIDKFGIKEKQIDFTDFPHNYSALKDWLLSEEIRGNLEFYSKKRKTKKIRSMGRQPDPIIVYNTHQKLITLEEDQNIKNLLQGKNQTRRNYDTIKNPFQGLMFCAGCGSPMRMSTAKQWSGGKRKEKKRIIHDYVVCKGAYPISLNQPQICDRRSAYGLELYQVEEIVIETLVSVAQQIAEIGSVVESSDSSEVVKLKEQIARYELLAKSDPDLIPILDVKRRQLYALAEIQSGEVTDKLRDELKMAAQSLEFWNKATVLEKYFLYHDLIDSIMCDLGSVSVNLNSNLHFSDL